MSFNIKNPTPDDLYQTIQLLCDRAAEQYNREYYISIGKLTDREFKLYGQYLRDFGSNIREIEASIKNQLYELDEDIKITYDTVKYYGNLYGDEDDELPEFMHNNEEGMKEWVTEIIISVKRWKK